MMVDSVADIADRQQKFPNKSTKVGTLLFFIAMYISGDVTVASVILLAYLVLNLIF
jgi:hypothetical protein